MSLPQATASRDLPSATASIHVLGISSGTEPNEVCSPAICTFAAGILRPNATGPYASLDIVLVAVVLCPHHH